MSGPTQRPSEGYISDLCAKAISTPAESPELEKIMRELRGALHEYMEWTRILAVKSKEAT